MSTRRFPQIRPLVIGVALVVLGSLPATAQIVVHDSAVTLRNRITAALKELLLDTQREQHQKLRRMARRLSMHTNLHKYALPDPPRWRTHGDDRFLFSQAYNDALIFGDSSGAAHVNVSQSLVTTPERFAQLDSMTRQAVTARLATVNLADATAIAAIHDTGQLRFNGRKRELPAITALEAHVIDPSNEQSATAVLDKISGAVLIGARQRQARVQLLAGVVEQLLVESKRARDTEAATINMQVAAWRDVGAANRAFVAGSGDALRTWRQP